MSSTNLLKSEEDMESSEIALHAYMDEFLREFKMDLEKKHSTEIEKLAQQAQKRIKRATEKGREEKEELKDQVYQERKENRYLKDQIHKEQKEKEMLKEQIHQMTLTWTKERDMWETKKQALSKDLDPNLFGGFFCAGN
jgi:hydroxylamine reductase (hybrid-cluster protein)